MTPQTLASINTSSATCEEDCTSAEPGASTAIEALGLGEVHTEDYILVEAFEGQKENNIQNPRSKGRPSGDGGDCRRSTFMVVVDHSEPSANTPEETVSEDEFTEGANQQGFENILTGKVVSIPTPHIPPPSMVANVLAEDRRYSTTVRYYAQRQTGSKEQGRTKWRRLDDRVYWNDWGAHPNDKGGQASKLSFSIQCFRGSFATG